MKKLPEDVVTDILLKLPVKSLLRFKYVCKSWYALIKSSNFIAMHLEYCHVQTNDCILIKRCLEDKRTNILSFHSIESLSAISPEFQIPFFNHDYVQVLGPCNGIVCITNYHIIVLCNPATREFKLLPPRPFGCPNDKQFNYRGIGFGFDSNTNDYKVVRVVEYVNEEECYLLYKTEIHDFSTNAWREIDAIVPGTIWYEPCFETFFHDCCHWYTGCESGEKILSFNVSTELFQGIEFPVGCLLRDNKSRTLTVLNESLTLIAYTDPRIEIPEQFIDVWVMKEYGVVDSWTKQFIIGPLTGIECPLSTWKNNVGLLLESKTGQLVSLALGSQEIKEYEVYGAPTTLRAVVYKESLVSM